MMGWRSRASANHDPARQPPIERMQCELRVLPGLEPAVLPGNQPPENHSGHHGAGDHPHPHDQNEQNGLIEVPPQEALLRPRDFGM